MANTHDEQNKFRVWMAAFWAEIPLDWSDYFDGFDDERAQIAWIAWLYRGMSDEARLAVLDAASTLSDAGEPK